jgi:hypothetical protein
MILTAALAIPAMAQPGGRGGFGGQPGGGASGPPGRPNPEQQAEIDQLKKAVKELEAKLNKQKEPERKAPEARKPETRPEPRGDRGGERGPGFRGPGGPPQGGFRGPAMGNPMSRGPGGPGFRGPMGGSTSNTPTFNFPGMNNLTPEEQATFRKLVGKMSGQPQSQQQSRRPEGPRPSEGGRKPEAPKQPEGGRKPDAPKQPTKQPNLEERLDRLEKMVQELARTRGGR